MSEAHAQASCFPLDRMFLAPSQHKPGWRDWGRGGRTGKKEEEVGKWEEKERERERNRGTKLRRKGSMLDPDLRVP